MYEQFNTLDPGKFSNYDRLYPIDYEIYVPLEYWEKGASIVPKVVSDRVNQMRLFYQLYQGDYRPFLGRSAPVRMNYHKITTSFVSSLMMMFPPEVEMVDGSDLPVSGRFIQQLNLALRGTIADMVRYGTGLFRISPGRWGSEIKSFQPVLWYPVDSESDTLAISSQDYVELWHDIGEGEVRYERYRVPDWNKDQSSYRKGTQLGELDESDTEQYGDPQQWDAIQSLTLGRPGLIIPVAAEIATGDWGESIYPELTTLALEVTHRLSENKAILDKHGNPIMIAEPAEYGSSSGITEEDLALGGDLQKAKFRLIAVRDRLNEWRTQYIGEIPDGYVDMRYLEWGGNMSGHFEQILKCEELLFAATRLPAAFFNIGPNGLPPSGIAMQRQFTRTYAYIRNLVSTLQDSITRAVLVGAMLNGSSASELQSIYDRLEIKWRTIFDEEQQDEDDISPEADVSVDDGSETEMEEVV